MASLWGWVIALLCIAFLFLFLFVCLLFAVLSVRNLRAISAQDAGAEGAS